MQPAKPGRAAKDGLRTDEIGLLVHFLRLLVGKDSEPRFSVYHRKSKCPEINRANRLMIVDRRDKRWICGGRKPLSQLILQRLNIATVLAGIDPAAYHLSSLVDVAGKQNYAVAL